MCEFVNPGKWPLFRRLYVYVAGCSRDCFSAPAKLCCPCRSRVFIFFALWKWRVWLCLTADSSLLWRQRKSLLDIESCEHSVYGVVIIKSIIFVFSLLLISNNNISNKVCCNFVSWLSCIKKCFTVFLRFLPLFREDSWETGRETTTGHIQAWVSCEHLDLNTIQTCQ